MKVEKYTVQGSAFELGFLLGFISKHEDKRSREVLQNIKQQLIAIQDSLKKRVGVTVEKLPNGMLKFVALDGTTIIREPYEWEEY